MTFIAAGTALAAAVLPASIAASTAAIAAGTGIAAGAAGAGLGAIGGAITGGDIGQAALMGGVSGMVGGAAGPLLGAAGVGGATMGGNIAAGGIAGAAGGAAGSAAGGEDIGKGALMGGAMGGIGGAMKGVAPAAGEVGKGPAAVGGMTQEGSSALAKQEAASAAGMSKLGSAGSFVGDEGTYASNFGATPTPSAFQSGLNAIGNPSGMDVAKAVAPGLISGAVNGGGYDAAEPYKKPKSSIGGAPLSKDFKPYWANSSQYYAEGGAVDSMQAPQPMNKFYEQGLQMAQQAAQQQQQQAIPAAAPQGIAQAAPQAAPVQAAANGGMMHDNLGGYSHGGIAGLTRGPGDGVSDDIPAEIGDSGKQPARLADGEFVISSRIVSELGNGSTEAGAKRLQAMVDRVQSRREKSIGKGKVAVDSKARKELLG